MVVPKVDGGGSHKVSTVIGSGSVSISKKPETSLLDIAKLANISATAFQVTRKPGNDDSDKKIFIPVFINKFRVVGCMDPGSDLTLLRHSLFKSIFNGTAKLKRSDIPSIMSFSDDSITILGTVTCNIKLEKYKSTFITVTVYVIPDIPNQTPLLLGNDFLRAGLGMLAYEKSGYGPVPTVQFKYPTAHKCQVYYIAPRTRFLCSAFALGPQGVLVSNSKFGRL
jgi:hypothetical protein